MAKKSNEELSQGARANVAGKAYEDILINLFEAYGYEVIKWAKWRDRGVDLDHSGKVAIQQFPYESVYHHNGKTEYLLVNNDRGQITRIELKTQRSAGSKDECLPYLYLNSVYAYPEDNVILLIEGDGFKPGAKVWLKDAVEGRWLLDEDDPKDIKMLDLSGFVQYFIVNLS